MTFKTAEIDLGQQMQKATILVVDDEDDIRELVEYSLKREGYETLEASTGEEALALARRHRPNLIVLDLMLPGVDGLEVCRRLKGGADTEAITVIMLTARGGEADIVTGLELGADDYVTKPFSPRVLVARIRSALRRHTQSAEAKEDVIRINSLVIDPGRHEVLVDDDKVDLTFTEFRILQTLARRPGRVFTRYQIIDSIHGGEYVVTDRAVDVQIAGLRKKLGKYGDYVETVRGVGYRFKD
ncbi:MAG: response regulator [Sedimentisphaerales bacterium]|nr:response regulator [Sedimentisphaerales bacterium]